jgi:aspartyl-tRNA(Asn)/glutamyl-tRNA(Gln) amidotransferase subunit B
MVDDIIAQNPEQAEQCRKGKDKVIGFLVGQVMKISRGKANPQQVIQTLKNKLRGE